MQACFFATEKTAAVGFDAIKQEREPIISIIIFVQQDTYIMVHDKFSKPCQALIALERDELEGGKEFCYANVIKCLRLR